MMNILNSFILMIISLGFVGAYWSDPSVFVYLLIHIILASGHGMNLGWRLNLYVWDMI
jgi:hypothetical protein